MTEIETAILKTIAYFAVFNFPVTVSELSKYLIEYQLRKEEELTESLKNLVDTDQVLKNSNWYSLPSSIVRVNRIDRGQISKQRSNEAYQIFRPLFFWPYLQGIFITGSVAAQNATLKNDTDVLIVTSPDTLWFTRMIVVIYLKLIGKYRATICPNIWITTDNLAWDDKNIYSAFNLVMTAPILNRNFIYEQFITSNSWALNFLPQSFIISRPIWREGSTRTNVVVKYLNQLAYSLQKRFMKNKMTSEEVTLNKAHFKKNDNRQRILDSYQKNLTLHIHAAHPTHS